MRRGFTLLELVVVAALLALVAAMVVPRLTGMARREADVAAERVTELLSMFALRDNSGSTLTSIWLENGCMVLKNRLVEPGQPDEEALWEPDWFVQPVCMPEGVGLEEVRCNGQLLPAEEWRVMGSPSGERPSIEIRLVAEGFDSLITLQPGASLPTRMDNGVQRETSRAAIDLDLKGLDREPW